MATTAEIAKLYFDALSEHDLDTAVSLWRPGSIDRFVGGVELIAPDGIREYFAGVFAAFPDFRLEIVDLTTFRSRTAVRWKVTGTFAGPGTFQGFNPNGAAISAEGCDVLTIVDDVIIGNDAYSDNADIARQLGFLPPVGSKAEARMAKLVNLRTRIHDAIHGAIPESIAEGVWVVRGGRPKTMNVYLIADEGGLTMFDAGISDMSGALRSATARLGGIKRIVLGHADCDHRGSAPELDAPVYCHPLEREAAESETSFRPYWDLSKLKAYARPIFPKLLTTWDGGAVTIEGTVNDGDEIAGFRVVHLPGHAPGLIGLFRESDRLALVSDCFYTLDPQTGIKNAAHVPHAAFNQDTEQARASIRKLAELDAVSVWPGHANAVTGDVAGQLAAAAIAPSV
jgi:glyoxylase-like metal-dependent hydrolase (beta-lactamase superfamily II)/predicted ester cyclase